MALFLCATLDPVMNTKTALLWSVVAGLPNLVLFPLYRFNREHPRSDDAVSAQGRERSFWSPDEVRIPRHTIMLQRNWPLPAEAAIS